MQGGYFQRATGKRARIKGSFLNQGTRIFGQEIALSLDYEERKTYEFVKQHLASRSSENVLGNAIYFVFEPDKQNTMNFMGGNVFQLEAIIKIIIKMEDVAAYKEELLRLVAKKKLNILQNILKTRRTKR